MQTEMPFEKPDPEIVIARGRHARALLADEMFRESVEAVEEKFTTAWKESIDLKDRETAWNIVRALKLVEAELRIIDGAGQYAERALDLRHRHGYGANLNLPA